MRVLLTAKALETSDLLSGWGELSHGAVVLFEGKVRGNENDEPIESITYDAYEPMAESMLERLAQHAETRWPVRVRLAHRLGEVPAGEASLVVVVASTHRKEAFEACQWIIDNLKRDVPIWKVSYRKETTCPAPSA